MNASFQQNAVYQNASPKISNLDQIVSNAVFTSHRITVPQNQSFWFETLKNRFNELTSLPLGWDGYGGLPVSFTCANFAANLLERLCQDDVSVPSLVPGSDGTLQIEWHENHYDIEIDVLGPSNIIATRFDHKTEKEDVLDLQSDFSSIAEWILDLTTNREADAQEIA